MRSFLQMCVKVPERLDVSDVFGPTRDLNSQ